MFHYTKCVLKVGPRIIFDYFSWMNKYARHPEKYDIEIRYNKLRKLLTKMAKAFDVEFHVEGLEKLPKETFCMVANHISNYDPLALITILDKPSTFVAKKELLNKPFIGKIMRDIDVICIDRKDLKQSLRAMMKVEEDLKNKKDKNWIIFPEGTRNKDQQSLIKEFHHGTFRPAVKANVPIVPIAIYGTFRVLNIKRQFKKYPVYIKILDPIYPEDYKALQTPQIAEMTREKIQSALSFELRKLDHLEMSKNDKKYKHNEII